MELTVNELVDQPSLGIYVKFRYTLGQNEKKHSTMFFTLFEKATIITVGYEEKDKLGKPTHPHLHYHMLIDDKIANIRGRLKTFFKGNGETRSGNELYSLSQEKDVIDHNRFFRYVWKQGGRARGIEKLGALKDFDVDVEIKCAMEEYARSCQFNNDKLDRSTRPNTYDKIEEALKDNPPTTLIETIRRITKFVKKERMSANPATMAGHANTYGLLHGIIDEEEFNLKILALT